MTLPLEEIEAKARAAPVGDALRAINAYLTILDPETVLALVARVRELEKLCDDLEAQVMNYAHEAAGDAP